MPRAKAPNDPDSYEAVHYRLRRDRGPASAYPCSAEGCPLDAREWSWDHTGEGREGVGSRGNRLTWGLDLQTYRPLCISHARMTDKGGTLTHCSRGHERATVGQNTNGACRGCAREDTRAWRCQQ